MVAPAPGGVIRQMPVRSKILAQAGERSAATIAMVPALALFGMILMTGCERPAGPEIVIEHEITPQPLKAGVSTITLRLTDAAGRPVNGAGVKLEGTMTHPGMRPVFSEAVETEPGRYRSSIEFTMGGDWVIIVHVTLPDGRRLERQLEVKGVQPG